MEPFDSIRWSDFGQAWRNISFAMRGFPMFMPGYCDECGIWDCHDPSCQQTREGLTHPSDELELQCNCVAIRFALGASHRHDLIGGHEPDCVCTNEIVRERG